MSDSDEYFSASRARTIRLPIPREEPVEAPPETRPALAESRALARQTDPEAITMMQCPCCRKGLVPADVGAAVEIVMLRMGDER